MDARRARVAENGQQAAPTIGRMLLGLIVRIQYGHKVWQRRKHAVVHLLLQLGQLL